MNKRTKKTLAPRRKPKQERARERVELILQSTRSILSEEGIGSLTTPNIAKRAGIPVSSIYQYFPNKQAIIAALYDSYLKAIRDVIDRFRSPDYLELEWRDAVQQLFSALIQQESKGDLYQELNAAITLYPALSDLDKEHGDVVIQFIADFMKKLGSNWSKPRLLKLSRFMYCLNTGVWEYRSTWGGSVREASAWEITAILSLAEQAFDTR